MTTSSVITRSGLTPGLHRKILYSLLSVGSFTVLSKLVAVLRDLVIASHFGTSDPLDAFIIAFLLPNFAIGVISGSLTSSLLPSLLITREREGKAAEHRLIKTMMLLTLVATLAAVGVAALTRKSVIPLIGSNFTPEKLGLTQSLFLILLPVLLFNGISTLISAVLNSLDRFTLVALTPIVTGGVPIISYLLEGKNWTVKGLALSTLVGFALEAAILVMALKKAGYPLLPKWSGYTPAVKDVVRQYVPMIGGSLVMTSNALVDQAMSARLDSGSVSALSFGNKVVAFILTVGSTTISMALFPYFSKLVVARKWDQLKASLYSYGGMIFGLSIPLTATLFYLSGPLVALLFERGAFIHEGSVIVSNIQRLYVLQIPFYLTSILVVRVISSLQANRILLWGAIINFSVNISMNLILVRYYGAPGIALSTSIVYVISFAYLLYMAHLLITKASNYESRG